MNTNSDIKNKTIQNSNGIAQKRKPSCELINEKKTKMVEDKNYHIVTIKLYHPYDHYFTGKPCLTFGNNKGFEINEFQIDKYNFGNDVHSILSNHHHNKKWILYRIGNKECYKLTHLILKKKLVDEYDNSKSKGYHISLMSENGSKSEIQYMQSTLNKNTQQINKPNGKKLSQSNTLIPSFDYADIGELSPSPFNNVHQINDNDELKENDDEKENYDDSENENINIHKNQINLNHMDEMESDNEETKEQDTEIVDNDMDEKHAIDQDHFYKEIKSLVIAKQLAMDFELDLLLLKLMETICNKKINNYNATYGALNQYPQIIEIVSNKNENFCDETWNQIQILRPIIQREKDNKNTGVIATKIIVNPDIRNNQQCFGYPYRLGLDEKISKEMIQQAQQRFEQIGGVKQCSEKDKAQVIILHEPNVEVMLGSIDYKGYLFEECTDPSCCIYSHQQFIQTLKYDKSIIVLRTIDIFLSMSQKEQIKMVLKYVNINEEILQNLTSYQLWQLILLRPRIIKNDLNNDGIIELYPLANMVFTRDQQIVTEYGIIMGNLNSEQRKDESKIMYELWKWLLKDTLFADKIYDQIMFDKTNENYKIEGGDYVPCDKDLVFIGCGLRTNYKTVRYLLENNLFGTCKEVIVVKDDNDKNQDRMHLDTVFNIIGDKMALYLNFEKDLKYYERNVEIWRKMKNGNVYELYKSVQSFREYLKAENWTIIDVKNEEQLNYMCNVVNLGRNNENQHVIVSVHHQLPKKLKQAFNFQNQLPVSCTNINYRPITRMYGAAHCNTQVFR